MSAIQPVLHPAAAAATLGISAKALRVYEDRGLLEPIRNSAGWRFYGGEQMARANQIVALRGLGLSLAQIGRVLEGDKADLDTALTRQQAAIDEKMGSLVRAAEAIRRLRDDLATDQWTTSALTALSQPTTACLGIDLPWPWAGERFELSRIAAVTYIVGPLGSGKTRLSIAIAGALQGARFIGLERELTECAAREALAEDVALRGRVEAATSWLLEDGAVTSPVLLSLLIELCGAGDAALVIDMVEDGLDEATQLALAAWLRRRNSTDRPLFVMTRSNAILDLALVGSELAILFCPANHSPPVTVLPFPGAAGYEALASCLATPSVRLRSKGATVVMPQAHSVVNSPG